MIIEQTIRSLVETYAQEHQLFVVDVLLHQGNVIEVEVDKFEGIGFDDCAALTRYIEANLNRDEEDYELTVSSPGLGQALKVAEQYQKLIGKEIEILLKTGEKITATLTAATPDSIDIAYSKKQLVEGKKRKQSVQIAQNILLSDTKTVKAVVKV